MGGGGKGGGCVSERLGENGKLGLRARRVGGVNRFVDPGMVIAS